MLVFVQNLLSYQRELSYCFGNFPIFIGIPISKYVQKEKSIETISVKKLNNLMLSSIGEANHLTLGTYSSAIALATEEAHFRHLRHFRTLRRRR